ncbi:hypothetical protein H206_05192 [Candidatus Electrothrix aarhusensis]|uniref:Uncharacterized protein n=1 Tax=Candidatus Electrothrix aarhusensis TaxID=1859131 RepID=A0A3S3QM12_9BACT|nr:hypothetical protein H206_05192 [Candidatus Electrothrix aarhusensis]
MFLWVTAGSQRAKPNSYKSNGISRKSYPRSLF